MEKTGSVDLLREAVPEIVATIAKIKMHTNRPFRQGPFDVLRHPRNEHEAALTPADAVWRL